MTDNVFFRQAQASRTVYDDAAQQEIYENVFQVAFKESANLSRSVYYTSYLGWVGKIRELALNKIGPELATQVSSGDWGLVTNWATLKIFDDAYSYNRLLGRFRIGRVKGSVIPLRCEFYRIEDNDSLRPLALVEQETTWVEVVGHGRVKPSPFPPYLASYLESCRQRSDFQGDTMQQAGRFSDLQSGALVQETPLTVKGLPRVACDVFVTTLEDANLVGNVYYANYFIWQGRVRDQLLHALAPECFHGTGVDGEMICKECRLDYLRDAMPFDKVQIILSVKTLYENKVEFRFEYFRLLGDGKKEKLAVGKQEALWVKRDSGGKPVSHPFPQNLLSGLKLEEKSSPRLIVGAGN